jgi:dephospho-CoA kinase
MPVIDADELARSVVAPDSEGLSEIVKLLGPNVLCEDGSLNRSAVAARIFADTCLRRRLEAITHPRIRALLRARLDALEAREVHIACYEAPLLIEVGAQEEYRPLVVVSTSAELQQARVQQRDALPASEVLSRIAAQLPLMEKESVADYVIHNNGSLQSLLRQADRVLDAVCARLGVDVTSLGSN